MAWKKVHKKSGATMYESHVNGCRLWAAPRDWTNRGGASVWSVSCGAYHKRGSRKTLKSAKDAARHVAARHKR